MGTSNTKALLRALRGQASKFSAQLAGEENTGRYPKDKAISRIRGRSPKGIQAAPSVSRATRSPKRKVLQKSAPRRASRKKLNDAKQNWRVRPATQKTDRPKGSGISGGRIFEIGEALVEGSRSQFKREREKSPRKKAA